MTHCLRTQLSKAMKKVPCLIWLSFMAAQSTSAIGQNSEATVSMPDLTTHRSGGVWIFPERNFGYVIGDVITQSITLPDADMQTDPPGLFDSSRVSTWLKRQDARIASHADGSHTLTLNYQIINAPQSIIRVALPELTLTLSTGKPMQVPAWPFTLGPLTASAPQTETAVTDNTSPLVDGIALKADMSLALLDDITPAAHLRLALLFLSLTLLSWAGWYSWRNYRDKVRLPFAQALQSIRTQKHHRPDDTDLPWKALPHGFNQSAKTVVNTSSIDTLIETHDWLRPLEPRIRSFYAASAARHYVLPSRDEPFAIEELARALADCERRNSG